MTSQEAVVKVAEWAKSIKSPNSIQWSELHDRVVERVRKELGDAPTLSDYTAQAGEEPIEPPALSAGQTWRRLLHYIEPLDWALVLLLLGLIGFSLTHMAHFSATIAVDSYTPAPDGFIGGIWFAPTIWTLVTQLSMLAVSEIPTLIFFTMYSIESDKAKKENRKKTLSTFGYLAASVSGALIVLFANIWSLLHKPSEDAILNIFSVFLAIVIPGLTMFLGHRLSEIFLEFKDHQDSVKIDYRKKKLAFENAFANAENQYQVRAQEWHSINLDPKKHPSYQRFLASELIQFYKRYKSLTHLENEEWTPLHEKYLAAWQLMQVRNMEDLSDAMDFFGQAGGV